MGSVKIGIAGCAGRMGQMLVHEVLGTAGTTLAGGTEQPGAPTIGKDIAAIIGGAATGATVTDDPAALFARADVVIDFTAPAASVRHAEIAARTGKAMVIGTTGLSTDERARLAAAAKTVPIVFAPNMSLGVNLLLALVEAEDDGGPLHRLGVVGSRLRADVAAPPAPEVPTTVS